MHFEHLSLNSYNLDAPQKSGVISVLQLSVMFASLPLTWSRMNEPLRQAKQKFIEQLNLDCYYE